MGEKVDGIELWVEELRRLAQEWRGHADDEGDATAELFETMAERLEREGGEALDDIVAVLAARPPAGEGWAIMIDSLQDLRRLYREGRHTE